MLKIIFQLILILSTRALLVADQQSDDRTSQNSALLHRIEEAAPADGLMVLRSGLDRLSYRLTDPEAYARMVFSTFNILYGKGTTDSADVRQAEQSYLLQALERPEQLPTEVELSLVMRLRAKIEPTAEAPERKDVLRKQQLLFHAWRRMERETDPNYKSGLDDLAVENVPLAIDPTQLSPAIAPLKGVVSGMDPAWISDLRLRQSYEAAIARNNAKIAEGNRQGFLRANKELFVKHAEAFLTNAIRTGAVTDAEVISEVNSLNDNTVKERVAAQIKRK